MALDLNHVGKEMERESVPAGQAIGKVVIDVLVSLEGEF